MIKYISFDRNSMRAIILRYSQLTGLVFAVHLLRDTLLQTVESNDLCSHEFIGLS